MSPVEPTEKIRVSAVDMHTLNYDWSSCNCGGINLSHPQANTIIAFSPMIKWADVITDLCLATMTDLGL